MLLRKKTLIALVEAEGCTIGMQNIEEARLVLQILGYDPKKCLHLIDFYPSQISGLIDIDGEDTL